MVHRACERTKTGPVGVHVVVHGGGQVGATVVPVVQHSNLGATRVLASNFDRVFDSLGSRVDEHGLLREVSGGVLREKLTDLDVGLVPGHSKKCVGDLGGLIGNGLDHCVVGVTHGHHPDTAGEVNEAVAINVFDDRVVGAGCVNGEGRGNSRGHSLDAALVHFFRARTGNLGDNASRGARGGCVRKRVSHSPSV